MITGCGDGNIRAYDAKTSELRRIYSAHEGAVNCIKIANDTIYSGSMDATFRVWDISDIRSGIKYFIHCGNFPSRIIGNCHPHGGLSPFS